MGQPCLPSCPHSVLRAAPPKRPENRKCPPRWRAKGAPGTAYPGGLRSPVQSQLWSPLPGQVQGPPPASPDVWTPARPDQPVGLPGQAKQAEGTGRWVCRGQRVPRQVWGALISCSFVQQRALPRQWGSWNRGMVRRVEATQRASPVWVGTADPSGRPRGTAQGGASQRGLQRHDCRASLGSGGCGGTRSSRKRPHPHCPRTQGAKCPTRCCPQPQGTQPGLSPPHLQVTSTSSRKPALKPAKHPPLSHNP